MSKYKKILHLCNNYWCNSIYRQLFLEMGNSNQFSQTVFVPIKKVNQVGLNDIKENKRIKVVYRLIGNSIIHKLFLHIKTIKALNEVKKSVDLASINLIHAHTLFSDGHVAYEINKSNQTEYIVAVRNTDINVFLKIPLYIGLGRKIIINSKKIVFISPSYSEKLISYYPDLRDLIVAKSIFIPNGINEYWNINSRKASPITPPYIKLLYVGEIGKNKNILRVIRAVKELNSSSTDIEILLKIVGKGKRDDLKYLRKIETEISRDPHITMFEVMPKEELGDLYRASDIFIMPSINETFGLVYAEALSQGLPIIYTRGQGFDGVYPSKFVGYDVNNPLSVLSIKEAMIGVIENYDVLTKNVDSIGNPFSWSKIASNYIKLYDAVFSEK